MVLHTYIIFFISLLHPLLPSSFPPQRTTPQLPFPPSSPTLLPFHPRCQGGGNPQHPAQVGVCPKFTGPAPPTCTPTPTPPYPTTLHHTHSPTLSHSNGSLSCVQVAFYYLKNGPNLHFPPILHTRVLFLTVAKPPLRGPEYSGALPGCKAKSRHVLAKFSLPALKNRLFQSLKKNR